MKAPGSGTGLPRIRVLVVDDSFFMRATIKRMLETDKGIEVVGQARDGKEALEMVQELRPDVVTLDVEMPVMNGLSALKAIMQVRPVPVLMLSSLTEEGTAQTLQALELGAIDFLAKNIGGGSTQILELEKTLIEKVKTCAVSCVVRRPLKQRPGPSRMTSKGPKRPGGEIRVIAIGASTGGPNALASLIPSLPSDFPAAILVVQHMPAGYTRAFAERLNRISAVEVKEADEGDEILAGRALIARAGSHLFVRRTPRGKEVVHLDLEPEGLLHRPSVDLMMRSVAELYQERAVGVMMTGMGQDGLEGMRTIKAHAGKTLAQDRESCVVYGMPRSVIEAGLADSVVSLSELPNRILEAAEG